jgi:hypothetical protein
MSELPPVITQGAFTTDPASTSPVWEDESAYVKQTHIDRGRDSELDEIGPGTCNDTLRNTDRRYDSTYAAGPHYTNLLPMRRWRKLVDGPLLGTEFYGDFEQANTSEWVDIGAAEIGTGATITTDTTAPRTGARSGEFTVPPGAQWGSTSGERAELRRVATAGFGCGSPMANNTRVFAQFSVRFKAPWTMPVGWAYFHQLHADARYGQPPLAFRINLSTGALEVAMVTGDFPNAGAATAGSSAEVNFSKTIYPGTLLTDTWYDIRYMILWTTGNYGRLVVESKLSTDSTFVRRCDVGGIQTLPMTVGDAVLPDIYDKIGFYRDVSAGVTNVVRHGGYRVGHSWSDVDYATTGPTDGNWNTLSWEGATVLNGNPDFETTVNNVATAGSPTTTITRDSARAKNGTWSCKIAPDGAAAGQGAMHYADVSANRFPCTAGKTYTVSVWFSGDGAQDVHCGLEFFNAAGTGGTGTSLGITYSFGKSLRTTFQRHFVTVVAPAGALSYRIRTSNIGSSASAFWVDWVAVFEGSMDHSLFSGYTEGWPQTWPDRLIDAESSITAVDGFKALNLFKLANNGGKVAVQAGTSRTVLFDVYEHSVLFDQPYIYTRLNETAGTEVANLGRSSVTGIYKLTPLLGDTGLLSGNPATSVKFRSAQSEYVGGFAALGKFANNQSPSSFTLECWWKPASLGTLQILFGGEASATTDTWRLQQTTGNKILFHVRGTAANFQLTGNTSMVAGTTYHIVAVYTQLTGTTGTTDLYVNGVSDGTQVSVTTALQNATDQYVQIASAPSLVSTADGNIQEAAIYDYGLSTARITAHYNVGAQGFAQQLSGARVGAILDLVGAWATNDRNIQAGQRSVIAVPYESQTALSEIQRTVIAEWPALYFQAASGRSTFLDRDWRTRAPYTTSQAIFGDNGTTELPYETITIDNQSESFLYNEVRRTRSGADLPMIASDATSKTKYLTRVLEDSDGLEVDDTQSQAIVDAKLARFKNPMDRITEITFPVATDMADPLQQQILQQVLMREIGDQITITRRPKGGAAITQSSYIERIRHDVDFEMQTWNTTYAVSPR